MPHERYSADCFLGSPALARVLQDLRFTCLDIGARCGFTADLLALAPSVDAIGFEPDREECDRLNATASRDCGPWRSLRYLPVALGRAHESRTLHVYRERGCSSLYEADLSIAADFGREAYFALDATNQVQTMPTDTAAAAFGFTDACYMKIDVQGAELEILQSAETLLANALLVIRAEVEFIPLYHHQPLYSEIELYLRQHGFLPTGFIESHTWRRLSRQKHPSLAGGPVPYSRGQLIHGDVLFFRDPQTMRDDSVDAVNKLLKASFLSMAYEYVDHAFAILSRPSVMDVLAANYGVDPRSAISAVSNELARRYRRQQWYRRLRSTVRTLRPRNLLGIR